MTETAKRGAAAVLPPAEPSDRLTALTGDGSEDFGPEIAPERFPARTAERLRVLWEGRGLILRITLAGLLSAILLAFLIPKQYTSEARLMPPDSQSLSGMAMMAAMAGGRAAGGLAGYASDLLGLKEPGALFVGILNSRTVADRLITRFDLRRVYGVRLERDARKELAKNTAISEDRKSGIISISVTDHNAERSAALAGAYIEELNRLAAELSTSSAHRERVFLEERLKAVKQDLEMAEKEFSQFASKNTAIDIKEQGRAMVESAARLQGELIAAQSELEGLKQIYTDNNVRVRAVRARIAELRRQIGKLGGEDAMRAAAGGAKESLYPSIRELPLLGVTYADLYRRTKIQETVYEVLTQQYELAKVQEAKETPSVKVLDAAHVPETKSFPPRLLIMLLGTMLAMAVGVTWILARKSWDETDPQDPRKALALEIYQTSRKQWVRVSTNGTGWRSGGKKVWSRLRGRQADSEGRE